MKRVSRRNDPVMASTTDSVSVSTDSVTIEMEPERRGGPVRAPERPPLPIGPGPRRPKKKKEGSHEPGIFASGWNSFKGQMREAVRYRELAKTPYGLRPIFVMGAIFLVSGYNAAIFGLASPDIVRELEINLPNLLAVMNFLSFFLIFGSLGIAYLLDRKRRIPFLAGGTIMNGLFSVGTSGSYSIWAIGATRAGDSLAETAASTPAFSLLSDYYPVEQRGKMFAFAGALSRLGTLGAPLIVGWIIVTFSWRVPFAATGLLLVGLGVAAFFLLREPVRGYMERKALGLSEEEAQQPEPAPSFGEAWRTVWSIRTLRRLFIADIFQGVGDRIYLALFPFYLVQVYHLDSAMERGYLLFTAGIFALLGGIIGGGVVDTLMRNRPQRVLVFTGMIGIIGDIFLLVVFSAPPLWVVYVSSALFTFFMALLGPARAVFFAQIVPAHLRTLGLSVSVLASIPAVILYGMFIPRIDTWGLQGVLYAAIPFFIISGVIYISSAGLFERDTRNAMLSQSATLQYRRDKEAGTLKLLICKGVEVEYDGVQVLFGVDFEIEQGEIVALLGSNGAGKSTLLKAISGVHEAAGGAIVLDGRDITHVPPYEIASLGIVLMPGGKGVFPGLTVRENLSLGTWGQDDDQIKERMAEVEEMFPALRARMDSRAGTLSGGEQQMLALAMAFLSKPRLLLIDELSLGLAPAVVQELLESVRKMRDSGMTIILVEQSVNVALTVAERAVFMEKGEVRFSGKTKELLKRPDILRAVYVKGTAAVGGGTTERRSDLEVREPILQVQGLSVAFGGIRALDDVTFDLHDGEILGIVGPNGAGKTTLFDVISGFQPPLAGRVLLEGEDVTNVPPDKRARLQLVRRFQDARLYPSLTVFETIMIALDRHHRARSMVATAVQTPRARQSERLLRRRADELIDLLGLTTARDKFVRELSTGMRRIADLAVTLAAEPKVLLLDEPSSGIAQAEAEQLAPLIRRIRKEAGCSILLIEHDMPLITRASDELMAMVQGRVVVRGSADEVLSNPLVVESYLGTSEDVIKRSGVVR